VNVVLAAISIALGLAYLALACIAVIEVVQARRTRGISRFGLAYVGMALSCGPHHLIHGAQALEGINVTGPVFASVLLGLPAGVVFVGLRVEAMVGGRGDRHIRGTPTALIVVALGFCFAAGALVTAAALRVGAGHRLSLMAAVPNLFVTVTYSIVGVLLLRTQAMRRVPLEGWSLSGLSLGAIFPSCALMHLVYALSARGDLSICPADLFGLPASAYFLWVVHRLYRQTMIDWNRRPIVGAPRRTPRDAPWAQTADPREDLPAVRSAVRELEIGAGGYTS
jgi:hypothetical protein